MFIYASTTCIGSGKTHLENSMQQLIELYERDVIQGIELGSIHIHDDEILLMDPIIRNAGLILCIETDKKNQYSIERLFFYLEPYFLAISDIHSTAILDTYR